MAYAIQAGIQISLDGNTWYRLTDHNRKEIQANPTEIQKSDRMANGIMRKYVVDTKMNLSTSWEFIPAKSELVVDYTPSNNTVSAAWMTAFYSANVFLPIYVKLVDAKMVTPSTGSIPSSATYVSSKTGTDIMHMYITKFSTTIVKRNLETDFVNMDIELTEI